MKPIKITLIAAMEINGGIGYQGKLPWHCPEDLAHFKQYTNGKVVVIGRKTWDSLPLKPLPNRENWVLSQNSESGNSDANFDLYCNSIDSILNPKTHALYELMNGVDINELVIIGGASIYQQFLPHATHMVLTSINEHYQCDTFFPHINPNEWDITASKQLSDQVGVVHWQRNAACKESQP